MLLTFSNNLLQFDKNLNLSNQILSSQLQISNYVISKCKVEEFCSKYVCAVSSWAISECVSISVFPFFFFLRIECRIQSPIMVQYLVWCQLKYCSQSYHKWWYMTHKNLTIKWKWHRV
jgi:hypothetical protein